MDHCGTPFAATMTMASYPPTALPVALATFLAVAMGGASCARTPSTDPPASGEVAALVPTLAPPAADEDEDEPAGSLVVHDDVAARCPTLKKYASHPGSDDDVAVDAIRAIGDCMTRGGLRSAQRVVVTGGGRATKLFRDAITRFGVIDARLDTIVDNSDAADTRVDIALSRHPLPGPHDQIVVAVRKSQIVGFLLAGTLDD